MTFTGRLNAAAKSKPIQPRPRLCGSAIGPIVHDRARDSRSTATSYFQSPASSLTPADHLPRRQRRPGIDVPLLLLAGGEDLDVGAADVDDQDIHGKARFIAIEF